MSDRITFGELKAGDVFFAIPLEEQPDRNWDDVPSDIRETFAKLGIPEQRSDEYVAECIEKHGLNPNKDYHVRLGIPYMKIENLIGARTTEEMKEGYKHPMQHLLGNAVNLNTGRTSSISDEDEVVYATDNIFALDLPVV